jgi:hypothetical protein
VFLWSCVGVVISTIGGFWRRRGRLWPDGNILFVSMTSWSIRSNSFWHFSSEILLLTSTMPTNSTNSSNSSSLEYVSMIFSILTLEVKHVCKNNFRYRYPMHEYNLSRKMQPLTVFMSSSFTKISTYLATGYPDHSLLVLLIIFVFFVLFL